MVLENYSGSYWARLVLEPWAGSDRAVMVLEPCCQETWPVTNPGLAGLVLELWDRRSMAPMVLDTCTGSSRAEKILNFRFFQVNN